MAFPAFRTFMTSQSARMLGATARRAGQQAGRRTYSTAKPTEGKGSDLPWLVCSWTNCNDSLPGTDLDSPQSGS